MSQLIFYTHPFSRGRTVRWLLEELEVPYVARIMQYGTTIKSAEYLAVNPMGKVPAIDDNGVIVTEVAAICTYLADKYPEKQLAPALDDPERGSYLRWLFFIAGPMEMASTARAYNWNIDKESSMAVGCGMMDDTVHALEQALTGNEYLCGNRFTAVDLLLASYLYWGLSQKTIPEKAVFKTYAEKILKRPASVRANEIDDKLAKELG